MIMILACWCRCVFNDLLSFLSHVTVACFVSLLDHCQFYEAVKICLQKTEQIQKKVPRLFKENIKANNLFHRSAASSAEYRFETVLVKLTFNMERQVKYDDSQCVISKTLHSHFTTRKGKGIAFVKWFLLS